MNTERTKKFVNAIACDLEEGGFQQVSGTTLRRTLATAVSAALPLLEAGNPVSELAEQQAIAEFLKERDEALGCPDATDAERAESARLIAALAARQPGVHGWSGWATQKPGHMPKLWGTREIAELNHDLTGDARLIFLSEQPAQGIDLGQLRTLAQGWIEHAAVGFRNDALAAYDQCGDELLALIDRHDAAPGVG